MGIEGGDPIAVRQLGECGSSRVPLGLVLGIGEIAPGVLLLELLETGEEARALAAGGRDRWGLEAVAELGARGVDDRGRQHAARDRGQDLALDAVGRATSGAAAERRAPVVAPFAAALEMRLPAHPGAAPAVEEAAQDVLTERARLVADPRPRRG